MTPQHRLGFPVRILGDPRLRSHDSRRWQQRPHLSLSLLYLRDILLYLQRHHIALYRLSDAFAPYLTHPQHPEFHRQIEECANELAAVGSQARAAGIRLTMHLRSVVTLTTPDEEAAARALAEIEAQALLLDALGLDDALLVCHPGGRYGERRRALERLALRVERLSPRARRLLAIEHDRCFSLNDLLHAHARTGLRVIFDHLHHQLYNPERLSEREALEYALMTWPPVQRPKVHFSSPRTELRIVESTDGTSRRIGRSIEPPNPNEHSDYVHPFECIRFLREAAGLRPFDVMLEAKAGDLALLRLREDILRFAPELQASVG